jgi:hypothetical protein
VRVSAPPQHLSLHLDDLSSGSWEFHGYVRSPRALSLRPVALTVAWWPWGCLRYAIDWRDRPAGVVFRPHAAYNPNLDEYTLW